MPGPGEMDGCRIIFLLFGDCCAIAVMRLGRDGRPGELEREVEQD